MKFDHFFFSAFYLEVKVNEKFKNTLLFSGKKHGQGKITDF